MNERLIRLMEHFKLSPSIFADEIGVIRSSISHIINGRNKPGTELMQKVLERFPVVSAEWLLLGRGDMLKLLPGTKTEKKFSQLTLDDFTGESPQKKTISDSPGIQNSSARSIERIIVYYSDHSFEEFSPLAVKNS